MRKQISLLTLSLSLTFLAGCSYDDKVQAKPNKSEQYGTQTQISDTTEKEMEKQYLDFLSQCYTVYTTNIGDIRELFLEQQSNPSLIDDEEWNSKLDMKYQNIEDVYHKLKILPYVPKKYENVHAITKEAFGLTLNSKDKILEGIRKNNEELINEGIMMIQESGDKFDQVNSIINQN